MKYSLYINKYDKDLGTLGKEIERNLHLDYHSSTKIPNRYSILLQDINNNFESYDLRNCKYNVKLIMSDNENMNKLFKKFSEKYDCILLMNGVFVTKGINEKSNKLINLIPLSVYENDIPVAIEFMNYILNNEDL